MDAVDQAHLSIGEVLSLLQEEFPDVTISKIRFLESQGLIEPERTPSGYRRFHDPDIERLRWVLRQQRDHFLPLKVIKAKLDQGGPAEQPTLWEPTGDPAPTGSAGRPNGSPAAASGVRSESPRGQARSQPPSDPPGATQVSVAEASAAAGATGPLEGASAERPDPGAWLAALQAPPESGSAPGNPGRSKPRERGVSQVSAERISRDELVERSGVDAEHVEALVSFGLLHPIVVGGEEVFSGDAVDIAALTKRFVGLGVGVRNLRSYRLAVDREIGVIEALLLPLLKQRNPEARTRAIDTADLLAELGAELRDALVRQALAPHLR